MDEALFPIVFLPGVIVGDSCVFALTEEGLIGARVLALVPKLGLDWLACNVALPARLLTPEGLAWEVGLGGKLLVLAASAAAFDGLAIATDAKEKDRRISGAAQPWEARGNTSSCGITASWD